MNLPTALAELEGIDLVGKDSKHILGQVAELARRVVPGASEVSVLVLQVEEIITVLSPGQVARPARSSRKAGGMSENGTDLDRWQHDDGQGPTLDAAHAGRTVMVGNMASDLRWPAFAATALARGISSCMSIALPVQHALAASITFYATAAGAFDDHDVELGEVFADYAAVVVARTIAWGGPAVQAENTHNGMRGRIAVEQAKGILMSDERWTPKQAAEAIIRASRITDRPVDEIAEDIVETTQPKATP